MNTEKERRKWDRYYASYSSTDEDENILHFRGEFVDLISGVLPEGGKILEAGCGAGEQSLALAKANRYDVTLLDFSAQAIKRARLAFEEVNLPAKFLHEDVFQLRESEFDLVFNAGVLEHYSFDQQVSLLKGMASRSQKYVLVLVPNAQNYWYWLWRIQKTGQGLWPFGKEIPSVDLSKVFETAGLHYHGSVYTASTWTESFISGLEGLSSELAELLVQTHRSGLLPAAQTSYLLAALGSVDEMPSPEGWEITAQTSTPEIEGVSAALADALALQVSRERESGQLRAEFIAKLEELQDQVERTEQSNFSNLVQKVADIERKSAGLIDEKAQHIEKRHREQLAHKIQEIEQRSASALERKLHEVEESAASLFESWSQKQKDTTSDLINRIADYEQLRALDQVGVIRQIEHDHTGVLVNKIQEIEHLRRQIEALRPPPAPNYRQRVHAYLIRVFTKLGLISQAIRIKKILKRVRHTFRKQVPSEVSYLAPMSLGHPKVPHEKRVVILTYTFFDFDGNNMYYGGAERYLLELAAMIRAQGYYPEVYQCGNGYWVRYYQDLRVTGIDVGGDAGRLSVEFQNLAHQEALTIFSPFSLAVVSEEGTGVGISHGVFWDHPGFQTDQSAMQAIMEASRHLDTVVSVDTNTINWMRASVPDAAGKFVYIPNFVDTDVFDANPVLDERKIVVLYPRRLYRPRGFWLVAEVLPDILESYHQVEFHFVGRADKKEATLVKELISRYPGRVRWDVWPPEEMPQAYQDAHITVIPTVHSEGTSLSCLEALASGNAVIATNVGGLPNLILHNHNGLLIDVSAPALKDALIKLIENPSLRAQLAERGRQVALSFSIGRWRSQWNEVLAQHLVAGEEFPPTKVAIFPIAPGIPWEGIKQRPHHLATQLAEAGVETFWQNTTQSQTSRHPLLHILGPKDDANFHRPIVFVYYPFTYTKLGRYDDPFIVYDVLDDISIHEASDSTLPRGKRAIDYHQRLLEEADLVICSSAVLRQRLKSQRPDILLIPNGVDTDHFNSEALKPEQSTFDQDLKPRIGFHGAIAEWVDTELVYEVAKMRPNYEFILIGNASVDIGTLTRLPNVIHEGVVEYEKIPQQISQFDVGILPFRVSPMTHAVRPLKVLEYLAMSKPVVATPLEEIKDWPGVHCADNPDAFTRKIDQALIAKESTASDKRIQEFVAAAAWGETTEPLIEILSGQPNGEY